MGRDGGAKLVRGYWGDVVNSPYISFGIECETPNDFAKDLWKVMNQGTGAAQHRHHTVEISMYNILSYLYEMENGKMYEMRKKQDIYSGLGGASDGDDGVVIVEEKEDEEEDGADTKEPEIEKLKSLKAAFDGVIVHILSGTLESVAKKSKFKEKFDFVSLSGKNAHFLAPEVNKNVLSKILRKDRQNMIMCDTVSHMVPLNEKQKEMFVQKVVHLGKASGYVCGKTSDKEHLDFLSPLDKKEEKIDTSDLDDVDS